MNLSLSILYALWDVSECFECVCWEWGHTSTLGYAWWWSHRVLHTFGHWPRLRQLQPVSPTFDPELCWSFQVSVFAGVLALVFCAHIRNGQFMDFVFHFCLMSTLGFQDSAISEPFGFYIWHRKLARHGASLAFLQSDILQVPFPRRLCCNDTAHIAFTITGRYAQQSVSQGCCFNSLLTNYCQFSTSNVRATHQPIISLIFKLTVFDSKCMSITIDAYFKFITGFQFYSPFVPWELDFWIINLNVDFKHSIIIFQNCLIFNILDQSDRLGE